MSLPSPGREPVEELAEEFAARYRRGERPSVAEYTDKYPELAEQIRDLFPALLVMEQFGSLAGPPTGPFDPKACDRAGPPEQLGDYRVLREVGRGGMGVVYEAVQESLGRHVALKVLPFHQLLHSTHLERFRREARAAAQLHHTNIVPVFGVGEWEGIHYYAMQFIQGQGLDAVLDEVRRLRSCKSGPAVEAGERRRDLSISIAQSLLIGCFLDAARAEASPTSGAADTPSELASRTEWQYCRGVAQVGVQVAEALAYAHKQRILHRDIKPSNLLLDTQGTVWITDFGLAKAEGSEDLTNPGDIVGTVRFMAPERFQGKADARSDVYSLGITLYEMLALRPAFADSDRARLIARVSQEDPPRPRKVDPHLPRDLETIVLKAIAKEPANRYGTADALAEDLRRFLNGEPIHARPVGPAERLWRWCRRNPVVAGLTAAAALFLLVGTGVSSYFALQANQRAQDSLLQKNRADEKTAEALANAKQADQNADEARANLYAAHMNLAQAAWESGHLTRVREILDFYRNPQPEMPDLRGWEWYYQERLCHDELRTLVGHTNSVVIVAFSPDGRRLASADSDGTVKVWDAAGGQALLTRKVHDASVICLAFSPDGKQLASAAVDGTVKIWDATSGQEMHSVNGHTWVNCVAFSPDGKRLASPGGELAVTLWDIASGQKLLTLEGHANRISSLAFSADNQRLASADADGIVKVWDAASGKELRPLKGRHTDRVLSVAFSADGTRLASTSDDRSAKVWDLANGQAPRTLKGHSQGVSSVAFSPDGRRLASADKDGTVKIWEAATGRELRTLRGHAGLVRSVVFSPDGARLASVGGDHTVKLWDPAGSEEPRTLKGHHGQPIFRPVTGIMAGINTVDFSPDGRRFASADTDGTVKLWDALSGQELHTLQGNKHDPVMSVAFSPDGKRLASGARARGMVTVWDAANGQPLHALPGQAGQFAISLTFSPDGERLASADLEATVRVWNVASGQPLSTLKEVGPSVNCRTFNPSGTLLAIAGDDRRVRLWDIANPRELWARQEHTDRVISLGFSPDGRRLASGSDDRTVKVWDVADGQLLRNLKGHSEGILCVAFSPGGERLASGSFDGTVKIWDIANGQEVRTLKGHTGCVLSVAFSPDGWRLASAGSDMTVKLWDARPLTPDVLEERETLGLVELLYASDARKADVAENLRRNQTISEAVRKKALALAEVFWSSLIQRQASRLVESLFAKRLSKRQVLQAVRNDHTLSENVRQEALALAERWPEDPSSYLPVPVGP